VTFKELQRLVESQPQGQNNLSLKFRNKEFWIFDPGRHEQKDRATKGHCCFNHIIGLPKKDGKRKPIFDYERVLYRGLLERGYLNSSPSGGLDYSFKDKHLWVKKATGLGVTEFILRFMAWLCLKDDSYRNSQMVIVTGPNQELAIKLIKRMKELFEPLKIIFESKETVIELNGCSIEHIHPTILKHFIV
jgi:hypothetical protein